MSDRLPPDHYQGEALCHRCGIGEGTGHRYAICADRRDDGTRWPHDETCKRYTYRDLCDDCEQVLLAEGGDQP